MELIIGLGLLAPIAMVVAAMQYPWRRPVVRPYFDIVLLLLAPVLLMVLLQAAFGLPAGSCVERPLNNAPLVLIVIALVISIALPFIFRDARRFAIMLAIGLFPLTAAWGFVTVMSLAGCWI
ncbi:hypothetical protein [Brevundimonas sp.]|uniref:hypothetical protein n=1 Tax=Brevundimonas sp. TaxID=1871086 RepID=UPI002FC71933